MIPLTSLRHALDDPALFGKVLVGPSWTNWKAILLAAMAEPLTPDELIIFQRFTGRDAPPAERVAEAALVCGRRAGKDRAISVLASYIATCCDHPELVAGEKGLVLIVAPDQKQARIQKDYILGALETSPLLSQRIAHDAVDSIELDNQITIEVRAANFRRLRGPTCVGIVASESAYWHSENSANPDTEILNSLRPTLLTTAGQLFQISTPYGKKGELWQTYHRNFGRDGDPRILVVQGTSLDFNPTLDVGVINRALERDRASAGAEYLAQFRDDIQSFVSFEIVQSCVMQGVRERGPMREHKYVGHTDPSGGSVDSFALCVAHREGERVIIDAIREVRPPFSPEAVVFEFCTLLKRYRIKEIQLDRYAAEWPAEQFRKHGIAVKSSDKNASELFCELLPMLNTGQIGLLDHERLISQLVGLERRTGRSRDAIGHSPGAHDDVAVVVAGAAWQASDAFAHRRGMCGYGVFNPYEGQIAVKVINGAAVNGAGGRVSALSNKFNSCNRGAAQ